MTQADLIPEVRRLMSESKGDRVIAETLGITRHEARKLKRDVELEDARQGVGAPVMPFTETLRLDPQAWALRISARWRASINSFIETGQLLLDAKAALPHGEFTAMLEGSLPFSVNTGQRLMAIARDERISNLARAQLLPASWTTIYEISKLSDEQLDDAVERKIIRPDVERREIVALARPEASSDGRADEAMAREPGAVVEDQVGVDHTTAAPAQAGMGSERPGPSETPSMPGGGLAIAHNRVEPSDSLDYFPTPPWATRALFEHAFVDLPNPADNCWNVWEPACGEGHMAEVLREYCSDVLPTDIFDYGYGVIDTLDFLSDEARREQRDWIITNPPFGENSAAFVERALDIAQVGVAMFVRLQWLEGVDRYKRIFRDRPPTRIAFFAERVPLHKGRWEPEGDTMTAYIWLIWIKDAAPLPAFWIPPGCREALTRPDDAERFTQKPVAKRTHEAAEAAE